MKVLLNRFAILFIFAIICGVNNFAFAYWKDLEIVNTTVNPIYEIYITQSGSGDWGEDLLGDHILKEGYSLTVQYDDVYSYYDVKLVFYSPVLSKKFTKTWIGDSRINLSNTSRITIYLNSNGGYRIRKS